MFVVALFYGALFYVFFRTIPKIYVFLWRYKLTHMDNALKIYTLTSALHDAESIRRTTQCFLDTIGIDYGLCDDFGDFGTSDLCLIFVRTGGTEGLFRELLPRLTQKNAGQRGQATCIDWKSLDMELMRIAIEATCLVLDDRFEGLKREWESEE